MASNVITWHPTLTGYDWPEQVGKFIVGDTGGYSIPPTLPQTNAGDGLNQIIADLNRMNALYSTGVAAFAYETNIKFLATLVTTMKTRITNLRASLGYPAFAWSTIDSGKFFEIHIAEMRQALEVVYPDRFEWVFDNWGTTGNFVGTDQSTPTGLQLFSNSYGTTTPSPLWNVSASRIWAAGGHYDYPSRSVVAFIGGQQSAYAWTLFAGRYVCTTNRGVYLAPSGTTGGIVKYSSDGITWTNVTLPNVAGNAPKIVHPQIQIFNGQLILLGAVGPSDYRLAAWTSNDGITWTAHDLYNGALNFIDDVSAFWIAGGNLCIQIHRNVFGTPGEFIVRFNTSFTQIGGGPVLTNADAFFAGVPHITLTIGSRLVYTKYQRTSGLGNQARYSDDNGANKTLYPDGPIIMIGVNLYQLRNVGGTGGVHSVWKSIDGGTSWTLYSTLSYSGTSFIYRALANVNQVWH